jgi:hypothetical protein
VSVEGSNCVCSVFITFDCTAEGVDDYEFGFGAVD